MKGNSSQMLLKYDAVSQNYADVNNDIVREKFKVLLKCFIFISLLLFVLLLYVPTYFQITFNKKSVDEIKISMLRKANEANRTLYQKIPAIMKPAPQENVSIEGWGLNTSRFIPHYVRPENDTSLIVNDLLCSNDLPLLIIVCSALNNTHDREVIRETWGNFSDPSYKLAFLLGTTENTTLQELIEEESQTYGDIIQEDFIDSYNNLTLKSVMLLKYIKHHCEKVEYVLKSDDDMFVHVKNLLILVKKYIKRRDKAVLVGELICNAKPIHNTNSKWYSPRYMFKEEFYPHYLSGTGYLMDRKTAVKLYEAALTTPFFHLEDVYITGLCARKVNIVPRHNYGFSYQTRPLDPCIYILHKDVITSHRVTLDNMKLLWAGMNTPETKCKSKYKNGSFKFINSLKFSSMKRKKVCG